MTLTEKNVYNTFLRTSRSQQGKGFSYRKNFDGFDPVKTAQLQKINNLLLQYPHINIDDFFTAPYKAYDDVGSYYDLKFFTTRKAITAYTQYMKRLDRLDPDSPEMLERVAQSLKFIKKFCKDKDIPCSEYFEYQDGAYPTCLMHIKHRNIWLYSVVAVEEFNTAVMSVAPELINILFSDNFYDKLQNARTNIYNSVVCKQFVRAGFKQIFNSDC